MTTTMTGAPVAVPAGAGEAYWWTGKLATVKLASEETGGAFGLVEILAPPGLEIPFHVHHLEDETFYVLGGSVTFRIGEEIVEAGENATLFAPRDVPHAYTVGPEGARMLFLFTPGGFEGFVRDAGEPAAALTVPPPPDQPPDLVRLVARAAQYGVELVG